MAVGECSVTGHQENYCMQHTTYIRALDKREYLMIIFFYFSSKPYVVKFHLNHFVMTVQMRSHNIYLYAELTKVIHNYHQILPVIQSSVH